ncbi:MAG: tRNA (guanosine(37)-N1)-methyltransferase TrmD [Cyanobacteriota bacterium]
MKYSIITLFPDIIHMYCSASIIGRARSNGIISIEPVNPRDFTYDVHRSVDDTPYGGGSGMVLMCEPIFSAVESIKKETKSILIMTTPQGKPLNQNIVKELTAYNQLIILCGHYEGFDERIRTGLKPMEISVGDFVMTGGELAALCIIDSTARLLPGVLGKDDSAKEESFCNGLLEYPHYTRPSEYREMKVPEILLSGHHKNINNWRRTQSIIRTYDRRPDLIKQANLTDQEKKLLDEYILSKVKE